MTSKDLGRLGVPKLLALVALLCTLLLMEEAAFGSGGGEQRGVDAPPPRGVTYGGTTSDDDPVVIVLSRDGMSVRRISTRFRATCSDGQGFVNFVDGTLNRAINASGRFAGMLSGSEDLGSGVTARKTATLKARVTGKQITGSLRFHVDEVDAAGAVTATCDQTASFVAISARGRVFGGRTSQGGPIVVELAARRQAVREFHIGWEASCTPSGGFQVSETLTDFPLAGGRFGDDFTQSLSEPTGEGESSSYSLRGKLKRTRITGTLRVKTTATEATGATIAACDSGAVSYTARSG
jgi:hypothetical protein